MTKTSEQKSVKEEKVKEIEQEASFKGKYVSTTGKRKTSVARVRVYKKGKGSFLINDQKINSYFEADKINTIKKPLKVTGNLTEYDFSIIVKGGGKQGQCEAIRQGISRALIKINEEFKPGLKAKGFVTRDARIKERKKPGLKKARKAPQWSKR